MKRKMNFFKNMNTKMKLVFLMMINYISIWNQIVKICLCLILTAKDLFMFDNDSSVKSLFMSDIDCSVLLKTLYLSCSVQCQGELFCLM